MLWYKNCSSILCTNVLKCFAAGFLEKNTILLYVRNKCFRNLFDLNSIPNGMLRHSLATLEGEYDFVAFLSKIVDEPWKEGKTGFEGDKLFLGY